MMHNMTAHQSVPVHYQHDTNMRMWAISIGITVRAFYLMHIYCSPFNEFAPFDRHPFKNIELAVLNGVAIL